MDDIATWAAKVTEAGRHIANLLTADVRAFATGEVRRRFVETPTVADALDDDGLQALKRATQDFADGAAAALSDALGDDGIWLGAEPAPAGAPVTVIPAVEQTLMRVADDLTDLLERHGLGPDEPLTYRLPARFIDGQNLGTLTRSLWKNLDRYHAARRARAEASAASSRESRARRWDEA